MNDANSAQKQDPLAALEKILSEAKNKSGGDPAGGAAPEEKGPSKEEIETQQQLAEVAKMDEAGKLRDKAQIDDYLQQIQSVHETPEEQARLSQVKAKSDKVEEQAQSKDDLEIRQLKHKKI